MTDLIQRITEAIFRQEGMPAAYTNPGNLRSAPWLNHAALSNGFWQPATRAEGIAGSAHCVALRIAQGQTLRQLISAWAPPSDHNNTEAYIANVKLWAGIPDENVTLYQLMQEIPS